MTAIARPWLTPGASVIVARPPEDCDLGGVWIVESVTAHHAKLRQRSSYISADADRLEPAPALVLTVARQLDWDAACEAANTIARICSDAAYTAPEALDLHRRRVERVCAQLDAITRALMISRPREA